ncbi:hypothetical protein BJ944DRAFT_274261 [Cunninghamella echinulata]|nr:hypothetical protein BJ944DRAFT_274261 [Cunninghamella echinulata]
MLPPCRILPATCELCGKWLPDHQSSCPRNGVHPSNWSLSMMDDPQQQQLQENEKDDEESEDTLKYASPTVLFPSSTDYAF